MRLDNKVAIVTGGASGIGEGIAFRFAEVGARVVVFDINGDAANRISAKINGTAIQGDVSDEGDVRRAIDQTVDRLGSLHILINNAGIEVTGAVDELTSE